MCVKAEEGMTPEDRKVIAEIMMNLEKRRKEKKNPFKQFIKSLIG